MGRRTDPIRASASPARCAVNRHAWLPSESRGERGGVHLPESTRSGGTSIIGRYTPLGASSAPVVTRMQRLSKPLGTHIRIQDDIGIITVGPDGRSVREG
jgi:hypothetical protein